MEWLRGILVKIRASLPSEENSDSCSETSSQSSSSLDAASGSASRTSSQSSMSAEESDGSSASDSSSGEGSQDSRVQEELRANTSSSSDSDASLQTSSGPDASNAYQNNSISELLRDVNGRASLDADTDTCSQASIESDIYSDKHSERLFAFHRHTERAHNGGNWCSVALNYGWYDTVTCNYNEYTGKDFWKEVITFLNVAEPAFKACAQDYGDCDFYVHVSTPKNAHVKHLKQLLIELEPRYIGYSVPKLARLIANKLKRPRFSMRAVIEFQDKFGKDAALQMLENRARVMFAGRSG
ncbi:hypothetical protein COCOBI_04-0510 [Coccomyxa sp. Obi]|nr:hypothetical protein COCOBI_04-0510 [Coccomyxa sp. Obi]